jgi:hypothetical protein
MRNTFNIPKYRNNKYFFDNSIDEIYYKTGRITLITRYINAIIFGIRIKNKKKNF